MLIVHLHYKQLIPFRPSPLRGIHMDMKITKDVNGLLGQKLAKASGLTLLILRWKRRLIADMIGCGLETINKRQLPVT